MSVVISSPEYSFIKFGETAPDICEEALDVCLPVSSMSDLSFQVIATGDETNLSNLQLDQGGIAYVVSVCRSCGGGDDVCQYWARLKFVANDSGDVIGFVNTTQESLFDDLEDGDCFYLCLYKVLWTPATPMPLLCEVSFGSTVIYISCGPCMVKQVDTCYTSLIRYYSNEDSMGFKYGFLDPMTYPAPFGNSVRLPMYLSAPLFPTKRDVYTKSNGEEVKLSAVMSEVWSAETDWITKDLHKKLAIAMEHDSFHLINRDSATDSYFSIDGAYDIEWQTFRNYKAAKGKFKLKTTPLDLTNSNCT